MCCCCCHQVVVVDHRAHGVDLPEDVASIEAIMRRQLQQQKQEQVPHQHSALLATAAALPPQPQQ